MEDHTTTAVENRELSPDVAEGFRTAMGLDEAPATFGEWADATAQLLDERGVSIGLDAMCTAESTRHEARVGDDVEHFRCVFDALLLPFVVDDPESVDILSRAPGAGEIVEIAATREGVSASPENSVASFGVTVDPVPAAEREDLVADGYEAFCPYINAFPDEEAYETWTEETPEAATMSLTVAEAHALARTFTEK